MSNQEKDLEYREIFLAEALENFGEINRLLTVLEKSHQDAKTIQALFRLTHTLKGNATGMGYERVAELAHVLEDFFAEVRDGRIELSPDVFGSVFKAADALHELIQAVKVPKDVRYRGIKTKLELLISQGKSPSATHDVSPALENGTGDGRINDLELENGAEENQEGEVTGLAFSDLVQVPVKKLDNLLNMVSELVIERDRIIAVHGRGRSSNEFSRLNRISSDLQYSVMDIRLIQVGFLFNKFHRVVRDTAAREQKQVRLKLEGTETEIDRNVLQVISDSLIHLIRNAVGHGIEMPDARAATGKPKEGTITLSATSESDIVLIRIQDDGAGIDAEHIRKKAVAKGLMSEKDSLQFNERDLIMLIFEPGFSTAEEVTAISGRGVGMDVVKKALESVGGTIQVDSMKGEGTIFTLRLPSSMAVKSTLLFDLDSQSYAIPLLHTESVISIYKSDIHKAANGLLTVHLGKTIHVLFLTDLFAGSEGRPPEKYGTFDRLHPEKKLEIVVVAYEGKRIGFVVDKLLQQKEIVEKPLRKPVDGLTFLSGVTILGNGHVCLSLSIPGILNALLNSQSNKTVNV